MSNKVEQAEAKDICVFDFDILDIIDGITEDIIHGFIRNIQHSFSYDTPTSILSLCTLFYFDIADNWKYMYPNYVSPSNMRAILSFEPERITKIPHISYNKQRQYIAIGMGQESEPAVGF